MKRQEQLIEKYFSNTISEKEETELATLLNNDSDLETQFNFEKSVQRAVQETEFDRLQNQMNSFETEIAEDSQAKVISMNTNTAKRPVWKVAASIFFLVALGYFAFQFFNTPNENHLADNFSTVYPNTEFNITRGESTESFEYRAFAAYEQGDYETAIENFLAIPSADQQAYIPFYTANAYFNQAEWENAILKYKTNIEQNTVFVPESYWYLSLSHLQIGQKLQAIEGLITLTSDYEYKNKEANQLLKKLR